MGTCSSKNDVDVSMSMGSSSQSIDPRPPRFNGAAAQSVQARYQGRMTQIRKRTIDTPALAETNIGNPEHFVHTDYKPKEKNVVKNQLEGCEALQEKHIRFEHISLTKRVGNGAYSQIFQAEYQGKPVVVKRILRSNINEHYVRMFAEETELMLKLEHPNIVAFIGASWNTYSNICSVVEYLELGSLQSVLSDSNLSLRWDEPLLKMMKHICTGMAYLHDLSPPIIHRDLKSGNILVSGDYTCKINDFAMSRRVALDETMTTIGTSLWLAPEMIRGERFSEKADVYSFGIVLSELDTRKLPFHEVKAKGSKTKKASGTALMSMVAYESRRPSLHKNCVSSINDLFKRCTESDATTRPSFQEILRIIDDEITEQVLKQSPSKNARQAEPKPDVTSDVVVSLSA